MISEPVVSVLMPVYNSESYLEESVTSVLKQTFQGYELIVINDGSTDNSRKIIEKYAHADSRIRVIDQENKGLIDALNRGLQASRGKYLARMDSDDISLPDRLARQVAFMEAHPRVGACGTWIRYYGGNDGEWQTSADDQTIRCRLLFESVLAHPTVIMNRRLLEQHGLQYRLGYKHAEDYDLWVRIAQHAELANIPEVHLYYRVHPGQTVQRHALSKIESANRIRFDQLQMLGINPSPEEMALHAAISMRNFHCSTHFMGEAESFLLKILEANKNTSRYESSTLLRVIQERWFSLCYTNTALGMCSWRVFQKSPLSAGKNLSWEQKTKFLIRSLIRRK